MSNTTNPFKRVLINANVYGGTTVSWELDRRWKYCADQVVYTVQVGADAWQDEDEWVDVATSSPIGDFGLDTLIVDTNQRIFGTKQRWFYRVKLRVIPQGGGTPEYFYSSPTQANGLWERKDYNIAREIVRKELLRLEDFAGVVCTVFKKRINGTVCPTCLDWDTGEVTNPNCETCYGTGIVGGYYDPREICVELSDESPSRTVIQGGTRPGMSDQKFRSGRTIAYPFITTEDILTISGSDIRYTIQAVDPIAEIRAIPIIVKLELRQIPTSSKLYEIST